MTKLKLLFILSLGILGVLIAFTVVRPLATGRQYSEVARAHLLHRENESIVEFSILNNEDREIDYTICALVDGREDIANIRVPCGRIFPYVYHISPAGITDPVVSFTIYKEGESTPFEQVTYYLSETGIIAHDSEQRVQEKK
ncbi:hypothetical protein ACFLWY_02440 [Chloroflexota bacterium]